MNTIIKEIGKIETYSSTPIRMWQVDVPVGKRAFVLHSHSQMEISTVLNGSGIYTVGGIRHEMKRGDFFVFCSNEVHFITDIGQTGLSIINLQFNPEFFTGRSINALSEEASGMFFQHSSQFQCRIPAENNNYIEPYFSLIRKEFEECSAEYPLAVKSQINLLLISLIRNYDFLEKDVSIDRKRAESMGNVLRYINENCCRDLPLAEVAAQAFMSPNYFSYQFRKTTGIRYQDYLNARRIEKAITLLTNNLQRLTVLDIAYQCGFNNSANFNKAFKKQTGMTPTEYLR